MEQDFRILLKIHHKFRRNREEVLKYLMLIYQALKKADPNLIDCEECLNSAFEACEMLLDDPPWYLVDDICMVFLNNETNIYQIEKLLRVLNEKNFKNLRVSFLSLFLKISNELYKELVLGC